MELREILKPLAYTVAQLLPPVTMGFVAGKAFPNQPYMMLGVVGIFIAAHQAYMYFSNKHLNDSIERYKQGIRVNNSINNMREMFDNIPNPCEDEGRPLQ